MNWPAAVGFLWINPIPSPVLCLLSPRAVSDGPRLSVRRGWCISCLGSRARWKIQVLPCENTVPRILLDGFSKANTSPARLPLMSNRRFNNSLLPRWFIWVYEGCFLHSYRTSGQKQPRNFARNERREADFLHEGNISCHRKCWGLLSIPAAGAGVCLREINDLYCFLPPWLPLFAQVL